MKCTLRKILLFVMLMIFLAACGSKKEDTLKESLAGEWYESGKEAASFVLYADGTCEIAGEYGTGTWSIVQGNLLKINNCYGEMQSASIEKISESDSEKWLILSEDGTRIQYCGRPWKVMDESEFASEQLDKSEAEDEREDESESEVDQENATVKVKEMRIVNALQDGTIWVREKLENGKKIMLHTNIYGEVLKTYEIPSGNSCIYGVNDKLIVEEEGEEEKIRIYDVEMQEEADSFYIGNYDNVKDYIQTENDSVFVVEKTIESFEEKYSCLGLVDSAGKEFFNISLDKDTLMNQYGIEPKGNTTDKTIGYAGNNVYYIAYIASDLCRENNSLIIDLNRNKITPVSFPQRLSGFGCESDGNYALVDCPSHGTLMIDLENDLITNYRIEDGFSLSGGLSEGLILVEKGNKKAYADTQGNIASVDKGIHNKTTKYGLPTY